MNSEHKQNLSFFEPSFPWRAFDAVAKLSPSSRKTAVHSLWQESWPDLSRDVELSLVQESCSVRNVLFTRELAKILIDEKGKIDQAALRACIQEGKASLYGLGPEMQYEGVRRKHVLEVLSLLQKEESLRLSLEKISRPLKNPQADQVVRDTLDLSTQHPLTDREARQAVLAAWMCYLRQNVGSCFATAPAIIVQKEQPILFLQDLHDLLNTGFLKRTFSGREYSFPMSYSWGAGDLRKPLIANPIPPLWRSPALLEAMASVGVFEENSDGKKKRELLRRWVEEFVAVKQKREQIVTVSVEELLQHALRKHLSITSKELQEYAERPAPMKTSLEVVQVPKGRLGGAVRRVEMYHQLYAVASNVFKRWGDNALLKTWEFTLASFAETKAQFTTWNLHASLGFGHDETGGVGECLYHHIKEKVDQVQREVEEIQAEYERAHIQLQYLSSRIKNASTEQEMKWMKVEYQSRANEFYSLEEIRDRMHNRARILAQFFSFLLDTYYDLFPEYFQEVYDADLHDIGVGPYDDSPAGFRLVFKHGRSHAAQWTRIHSPKEFIDSLVNFFSTTEHHLLALPECSTIQREVQEIITALIQHVQTDTFLESSLYRMAALHRTPIQKNPLQHIDAIPIKPWAYNSGGTMGSLVSGYFRREEKPTDVLRWVEKDTELLVYLLDLLKQMPADLIALFEKNRDKSLLMHSPTHAFLLQPGWDPFFTMWHNEAYTYTWVRDHYIIPAQRVIEEMVLRREEIEFLLDTWAQHLPSEVRPFFVERCRPIYATMTPKELRQHVVRTMQEEKPLSWILERFLFQDEIDGYLYESLPLFPSHQLASKLRTLFEAIPEVTPSMRKQLEKKIHELDTGSHRARWIRAIELQEIAQGCLALVLGKVYTSSNFSLKITQAAKETGLALHGPIVVADSNWIKDLFGFVVNPGTGEQEWWRVDLTGRRGSPMSSWRQWLDGSRPDRKWGVYIRPYEYSV